MLSTKEEELLELEKDNNRMLHKMYRGMMWGRVVKTIYWIVLLAIMFGAYYYIQPYIGEVLEKYDAATKLMGTIGSIGK